MALPTTGLTAHYDASTTAAIFTTFVSGGPHTGTPSDGGSVAVCTEVGGANRILKQSGANGLPVWRATTPLLPLPCLDFTGGQRLILTNNVGTSLVLSDIITNNACTILIAFWAESITYDSFANQPYNAHPLIGDTSGYCGAFLHSNPTRVAAYTWDGSANVVDLPVTVGAPHVYMMRHESGRLYASLDGGAELSVVAGNTQVLTANVLTGAGTYNSQNLDGRIGEIAIYNTALTGTALTDAVSYFTAKWLGPPPVAPFVQTYVWGPM
jgi:hypothetical protein